jgi:Endoglucanase
VERVGIRPFPGSRRRAVHLWPGGAV